MWRANRCTSLCGSKTPSPSKNKNMLRKRETIVRLTSLHGLSILWLWTDVPVITLPLLSPHCSSIYLPTSRFSKPTSQRTLEGRLYCWTASWKQAKYSCGSVVCWCIQIHSQSGEAIYNTMYNYSVQFYQFVISVYVPAIK